MRLAVPVSVWALVLSCGCADLPVRKEETEAIRNEIRVGRSLAARLIKKYGVVRDEEATRYVNLVGNAVASQSARSELTFHFGILDTDEVNAFSCPGGYILVTKGALRSMKDESELAFVLGHEVSHVSLLHSGNFQASGGMIDFVAGLLGAGATVVNSAVRQNTEQLAELLLEKGRQKDLEFEADRAGVVLAASLGYDPSAGADYLERAAGMEQAARLQKTHPAAADRVALMKQFILEQGFSRTAIPKESGNFSRALSRLQAGER